MSSTAASARRLYASTKAAEAAERRLLTQPDEFVSEILVSELAERWLATKGNLRFTSVEAVTNAARYVVLEFGDVPAANMVSSDVRVWLGQMQASASPRRSRRRRRPAATDLHGGARAAGPGRSRR